MKKFKRPVPVISSGSMADIAFLLLIFFLVATTITSDKGLGLTLPPHQEQKQPLSINERNLYKISINSRDEILAEGQSVSDLEQIQMDVAAFVQNNGADPKSSENPEKAIVSIQLNRGTTYKKFVDVLDAVQGAYHHIYASQVQLTTDAFRALDLNDAKQLQTYKTGKAGFPMNISIAEPHNID
jgi:biopolymer transport protein ExbD